jgi:hypothetical protein
MNPSRVDERRREQDAAWTVVRDLPEFGTGKVVELVGCTDDRARQMLRSWAARGMIHEVRRHGAGAVYAPGPRSAALAEPRRRVEAEADPDPVVNMWRAMCHLGQFSPIDIMAVSNLPDAPVSEDDARAFCQSLLRGEYLRVIQKAQPGVCPPVYRMARPTGPVPPRERRVRALWDDNLGQLTFVAGMGAL